MSTEAPPLYNTSAAAILCGGVGRRLGYRDKASIRFRGIRLVDRVSELVSKLCHEVCWVERHPHRLHSLDHQEYHRLKDHPIGGAGGAIISALQHYDRVNASLDHRRVEWVWIIACDLPLLTRESLELLAKQAILASPNTQCITFSDRGRPQPLCGLWRVQCGQMLIHLLQSGGRLTSYVKDHGQVIPLSELSSQSDRDLNESILFNINTIDDLSVLSSLEGLEL